MRYLIAAFFLCLGLLPLKAQSPNDSVLSWQPDRIFLGGSASFNGNWHWGDFRGLPGIPSCCPQYSSGFAFEGWGLRLASRYMVSDNLAISLRVGVSGVGGGMSVSESIGNVPVLTLDDPTTVVPRPITAEYSLTSKQTVVAFEPAVLWRISKNVRVETGLSTSILLSSTYNQSEKILSPSDVTYLDGSVERNMSSGDIPNARSLLLGGLAGVQYDIPLSRRTILTPEVRLQLPLMAHTSSVPWRIASVEVGASLLFDLTPARKTTPPTEPTEEPKEIVPDEDFSIAILAREKDGVGSSVPTVVVEEIESVESWPILPHVYFEENSAQLETTRQKLLSPAQAKRFREEGIERSTLGAYADMLNILGSRLRRQPSAKVEVTGCTDSISENLAIANNRANAVAQYLTTVWGIEPQRLVIRSSRSPVKPSNPLLAEGREENRRVEIRVTQPSDTLTLAPVVLRDTSRLANPPVVEILASTTLPAPPASWTIHVDQRGDNLLSRTGVGAIPAVDWTVVQNGKGPNFDEPVAISASVVSERGTSRSQKLSLPIEQKTLYKKRQVIMNDTLIERYTLIIFDFNESVIRKEDIRQLMPVVRSIRANSSVTILGYADKTGESLYNRQLAERRCRSVAEYLGVQSFPTTRLIPVGSDTLLYDNELPEGRAYSRTVVVEVLTPLK